MLLLAPNIDADDAEHWLTKRGSLANLDNPDLPRLTLLNDNH